VLILSYFTEGKGCNFGGGERSEGVEEESDIHLEVLYFGLEGLLFLGDDFGFLGASGFLVLTSFFFFVAVFCFLVEHRLPARRVAQLKRWP
jgi:hypothetical protein